jgi:threonine dehydrogenase-like Zn-dependent dehydrogenase
VQPLPTSTTDAPSPSFPASSPTPLMNAIAVRPGVPGSMHLTKLPRPALDDVPDGRGVLVKVLRVGVDGTDKEINAAEYGAAPPGSDVLVTGHESFGRVEAVGPAVTELAPGDFVVATVRRPGSSLYDRIGTYDMTTDATYFERGINLRHGFLTEYYVDDPEYIVKVPGGLQHVGVLLEPLRSSAGCGSGGRAGPRSWGPARLACWRRWSSGCAGWRSSRSGSDASAT